MKIYNVDCDNDIDDSEAKKFVTSAIEFLCPIYNVNEFCFDLSCVISEHPSDIELYREKSQDDENNNGAFIPTFFKKNNYNDNGNDKKNVVFINWKKIEKYDEKFIISIFIHEFSHFLDYRLCPKLEEKYNIHFDINVGQRFPDNLIYWTFHNWSEIRAKYYQMKYYNSVEEIYNQIKANCANINDCTSCLNSINSFDFKNKQEKEQLENKINYSCLHLSGLILAYEEINSDNILNEIQELKDKLKQNDDINNLQNAAFNINMLFMIFDKILEKSL